MTLLQGVELSEFDITCPKRLSGMKCHVWYEMSCREDIFACRSHPCLMFLFLMKVTVALRPLLLLPVTCRLPVSVL